jgi:hypothetical protein
MRSAAAACCCCLLLLLLLLLLLPLSLSLAELRRWSSVSHLPNVCPPVVGFACSFVINGEVEVTAGEKCEQLGFLTRGGAENAPLFWRHSS